MSDGTATRLSNSDSAPKLNRRLQRLYKQHVNNASQRQRVQPRRQTTAAKSSVLRLHIRTEVHLYLFTRVKHGSGAPDSHSNAKVEAMPERSLSDASVTSDSFR